jgi:hypothetical protein
MKKLQYSIIITFVVIMAAMFVCSLFPDNDGFSSFENRKLNGKPELSLSSIFNGKYESGYESYLLDNFLLRNFSVQSYQTYTELFFLDVFRQSEDVLMSIDVDTFVTAQKPENTVDAQSTDRQPVMGQQRAGEQSAAGQDPIVTTARPYGQQAVDGRSTTGEAASYQTAIGQNSAEQSTAGNSTTGRSTTGQSTTGQSTSGQVGEASIEMGQGDAASTDDGLQSAIEQDPLQGQIDDRLNNSLIISGDRVMMPTGANNLKAYGSVLTKIAEVLPGKNIYSITGPTSAAYFASDKYSTGSYDQGKAEGIIKASVNGVKVVKAYDMLLGHRDENIYFRSDVHWTALGAYYAYTAFCQSAGLAPASLDNDFTMDTYRPFLGGLYSQIYKQPQAARLKNNPEQLDYYIPRIGHQLTLYNKGNLKAPYTVDSIINTDFSSLGAYKYSCFAWGDQRIERINSDAPGGRKLLVVKDSYGSALVPFLVPNYSKIYVIDPKGFNQEGSLSFDAKKLIEDEEIDDIVFCFSIYGSGRTIIQNGLTDLFLR